MDKISNIYNFDDPPPDKLSLELFIIEKKIGKGQFSEVFRAQCTWVDLHVALKKIQVCFQTLRCAFWINIQVFEMVDQKARQDCLKEIDLLKQLNHVNVIRYKRWGHHVFLIILFIDTTHLLLIIIN